MLAQPVALWLKQRNIHYGWVIVAITFLTLLVTNGVMGLPGALLPPLTKEFGWNTAEISSALALRLILYGLIAPFAAALIERYGVRSIILSAMALLVAALLLALVMNQIWHLVFLWGILVGVGTGMMALVLSAIVAGRWFAERRGLVLGLFAASASSGQLVFLPLSAWLIEHFGWRAAVMPSLIGLAATGLLTVLFMRDRPADLGLAAYGEKPGAMPAAAPTAQNPARHALAVLFEARRYLPFWLLFGSFFVCGLSTNGLIQTHFISLCTDFGMPEVAAASTLAMMGAFDVVGTIASGWLSDRFDNRWLLFWYYGLRGLSLLYLPSSTFTIYGLSLFAAFYGLDWIATVPPTVKLTASIFGRERAGIAFGWIFAGHMLGAAAAALGGGLARTELLTYLPAFYAAGAACLLASVASLGVRRTAEVRNQASEPRRAYS